MNQSSADSCLDQLDFYFYFYFLVLYLKTLVLLFSFEMIPFIGHKTESCRSSVCLFVGWFLTVIHSNFSIAFGLRMM